MAITCKGWQLCPPPMRWTVFFVLSICMFSYMYTYDTPVALQEQLQAEPWNLSNVQYNLLFSAYAWPNVVFPIILGVLTDIIGVNKMLIILYTGMLIGNGIFVMGIDGNNFIVMLLGRCFYGISAESFAMAETPLLYEYFFGKELSFALGFNLSFSRLGSAANDVLTYEFYHMNGVVFSIAMGAFVLMPICLFILCLLIGYRVFFEKKDKFKSIAFSTKHGYSVARNSDLNSDLNSSEVDMTTQLIKNTNGNAYASGTKDDYYTTQETDMSARYDETMKSKYDYSMSQQQNTMSHSNIDQQVEETDSTEMDIHSLGVHSNLESDQLLTYKDTEINKFKFSDWKKFDTRYWLLVVNCCFQYGCVVPWMKIGGSYMQVKYSYSHGKANEYLMIPYIVSAIITPMIGLSVDKFGHRCELLIAATIILTLSHYVLGWLTPDDIGIDPNDNDVLPLTGLIGLGIGYSVFCAVIWPSFAVAIPPNLVGTGYGIPTSAYNLVLGIFFLLVGILTKDDDDLEDVSVEKYTDVEWFLLSTCICSIVVGFMLWHADRNDGNLLGIPAKKQIAVLKMSIA